MSKHILAKCLHYQADRNLAMAQIRNTEGEEHYRARIFCGLTIDYPLDMFKDFDAFVAYCRSNHELQAMETQSFLIDGDVADVNMDPKYLQSLARKMMEAKEKLKELTYSVSKLR